MTDKNNALFAKLIQDLEQTLKQCNLWSNLSPQKDALTSNAPFCCDTLTPCEWLQHIFIPKIMFMIENNQTLPKNFALLPYFEESFKSDDNAKPLLLVIKQIDDFANQ